MGVVRDPETFGVYYHGEVIKTWVVNGNGYPRRFTRSEATKFAERKNREIGAVKYEVRPLRR